MALKIPVVDLFAGPGGLSEGFSAHRGQMAFDVKLSIEKDAFARETLKLRKFFRNFPDGKAPDSYYDYISGNGVTKEQLYKDYREEERDAHKSAWKAELGKRPIKDIWQRISDTIDEAEHWILLGGPPCQAYSVIGRSRMRSMEGFAKDKRHTLYREYLKIVAAFQPTVFVMENVKGILSSRHRDQQIFHKILNDMSNPWEALSKWDRDRIPDHVEPHRYRIYSFSTEVMWEEQLAPSDFIIEAENYNIPQRRHRVILLGIRDDYDIVPPTLQETGARVTVTDVISDLPAIRSEISRGGEIDTANWRAVIKKGLRSGFLGQIKDLDLRKRIRKAVDDISDEIDKGGDFIKGSYLPRSLKKWYHDPRLKGIAQHQARGHMPTDLHRYLFSTVFAEKHGSSPKIDEFPEKLWPNHANAVPGEDGKVADFRDRFRVQVWDEPSTTITSHMRKDGHYFIHPDPTQCRSLSVREAARLQTFPDNYFFEGPRTEQYKQVGNAVPPYLAYKLSDIVAEVLEQCIDRDMGRSSKANIRSVS